jgi:hypothetical protein
MLLKKMKKMIYLHAVDVTSNPTAASLRMTPMPSQAAPRHPVP